ncbi:hypothetical protein COSO111634_13670 [Corallococcus soli]
MSRGAALGFAGACTRRLATLVAEVLGRGFASSPSPHPRRAQELRVGTPMHLRDADVSFRRGGRCPRLRVEPVIRFRGVAEHHVGTPAHPRNAVMRLRGGGRAAASHQAHRSPSRRGPWRCIRAPTQLRDEVTGLRGERRRRRVRRSRAGGVMSGFGSAPDRGHGPARRTAPRWRSSRSKTPHRMAMRLRAAATRIRGELPHVVDGRGPMAARRSSPVPSGAGAWPADTSLRDSRWAGSGEAVRRPRTGCLPWTFREGHRIWVFPPVPLRSRLNPASGVHPRKAAKCSAATVHTIASSHLVARRRATQHCAPLPRFVPRRCAEMAFPDHALDSAPMRRERRRAGSGRPRSYRRPGKAPALVSA